VKCTILFADRCRACPPAYSVLPSADHATELTSPFCMSEVSEKNVSEVASGDHFDLGSVVKSDGNPRTIGREVNCVRPGPRPVSFGKQVNRRGAQVR